MKQKKISKIEYINTPFSYTRQQQGLTLLQQNIMNRISAHLQTFFNDYWNNPRLRGSKEVPRTFMTDEQIRNLGPIRVELSELGISAGTYQRVSEARDAILNIKLNGVVIDDERGANDRTWNVISRIDLPITDHGTTVMKKDRVMDDTTGKVHKVGEAKETHTVRYRGYMDIYLNKELLKSMLDVTSGYVSHPENIASFGKVPNMPLMYYFLRHHMNNFKPKHGKTITTAKVELAELREYLGLTKRNARGEVVQEKYATYSQFKNKVMSVALADIKRVYDEGIIDFYFTVTEIRPRGKTRGTPSYLVFDKVQVKRGTSVQLSLFEDDSEEKEVFTSEYINEWNAFMAEYSGGLLNVIQRGKVLGKSISGWLTIEFDKNDADVLLASDEWNNMREDFKKVIGCKYGPGIQILTRK